MIGLKASVLAVITLSIYLAANTHAGLHQDIKKPVPATQVMTASPQQN